MIQLTQLSLQRGPRFLLEEVNLIIQSQQKVGVIGINGSGKSSFFALLRGVMQPDKGDISLPKNLRTAHLAQEIPALSQSALNYVLAGDSELTELNAALHQAEQAHNNNKIAHYHERLAQIEAYSAPARAAQLLYGLGFSHHEYQNPVSDFSGGWRMRLNLAQTLMCRSDLLLLDEPTNHLDLDALLWLEQWLRQYQGTLLLISHDRDFLDGVVSHIAHIDQKQIKLYTGNYSAFEEQRAAYLALQQALMQKQEQKRAHLQKFIDRFKAKASKARQAQSRVKALEKLETIAAVQVASEFSFEFPSCGVVPNPLLKLHQAQIGYAQKTILSQVNFYIGAGSRVGLLGPNGAGKSTLMKALAGELPLMQGELNSHKALRIGYFAQHQYDYLDLTATPLIHFRRIDDKTSELALRSFLGGFGFSGERALTPITNFSGGEKARLALALLVWQKPNLLLLDEPTNHLDLEMREALLLALQEYEGALVIVSHDRHLLRITTDELFLVASGKVQEFSGDLASYQQWLLDYRRNVVKENDPKIAQNDKKVSANESQLNSKTRRFLQAKLAKLDEQLKALSKKLDDQHELLSDPKWYQVENKESLEHKIEKQTELKAKMQAVEQEWLTVCEELEKLEQLQ